MKNKGFGLLGILIVVTIIIMVGLGFWKSGNGGTGNTIEQSRDAIDEAENVKNILEQRDGEAMKNI